MPSVSIILPTYNREKFLPEAFAAIAEQTFTDWELIVVDDGSTDGTRELVPRLSAGFAQPVSYIYQENQGAYGARNTGLDHATGKYIAFYDSDDLWLPHHLNDCVQALEANEDVDWVYGACQMVDDATGEVIAENTFYVDGKPRPFLDLQCHDRGSLRVIDDSRALEGMIYFGLYNGLQNSLLRARLFENTRFDFENRNEAEDQLFVIRALSQGHRMAYFDNVHVIYHVHDSNSSAAGCGADSARQRRVMEQMIAGYESLLRDTNWNVAVTKALRRRLSRDCFWALGYATLWQSGQRRAALAMFRRGIKYWPWDWKYWKTYCVRSFMTLFRGTGSCQ